jgi:hypothetical protein
VTMAAEGHVGNTFPAAHPSATDGPGAETPGAVFLPVESI